jgi:hypothetical protein
VKRWLIIVLGLVTAFCLISYADASLSINFDGKPKMFHPKNIQGYFVWGDDDGLHIRVTTIKEKHVFSGTIHTDGRLEDIEEKSLDDDDFSHLKDHDHTISFQFTTSGKAVGIDFYIQRGKYMDFDFSVDGTPITPEQIFVGKEGWHPSSNQFTLDYDKYENDQSVNENRTLIITNFPGFWWRGPRWHRRFW